MVSFVKVKEKKFTLRKEAVEWAKEEKKKHKGATGKVLKIDINVLPQNRWEAVLLRRV